MRRFMLAFLIPFAALACSEDSTSPSGPVVAAELLPADTVIKAPTAFTGHGVDEEGNVNNGAEVTWESITPAVVTVDAMGTVTPVATGIGQIRITVETFTAEATVRAIANATSPASLMPLFPFSSGAGDLQVFSDVSQADADARMAAVTGPWNQWTTETFVNTPAATAMLFTDWREIWTEFLAFCTGVDDPDRAAHAFCASPPRHALLAVDENETAIRFLGQQFMSINYSDADAFPWLKEGWSSFIAGGDFDASGLLGLPEPRQVIIDDFNTADSDGTLEELSALLNMTAGDFYAGAPTRAPVPQMVAQAAMFWGWLVTNEPDAAGRIFNEIRLNAGGTLSNSAVLSEMFDELGMEVGEVEALYLAWARSQ